MKTIAKEFRWEMGHRLSKHDGLCQNPHGHSYKLRLILHGRVDPQTQMLLDYYEIDTIVNQTITKYNHAFAVEDSDNVMKDFLIANKFKYIVLPETPTAERLCCQFAKELIPKFKAYSNITDITIRIYETTDVYAEANYNL